MPYIRDRDFARVRELLETMKELAQKEGHHSIPDIATRALKVIEKYMIEEEEK